MISTAHLTYDKATRRFTADASDLGPFEWVQALPDGCDEGLDVVSHATGRVVRFMVHHIGRDERGAGDLLWWDLRPTDSKVQCTLRIYND